MMKDPLFIEHIFKREPHKGTDYHRHHECTTDVYKCQSGMLRSQIRKDGKGGKQRV